ncbi:ABC transporter ATP-binding protein [Microlunatus parietis]|uniref:Iron complex transport system ATP-binding protein n=1 Tax=Microlunatus parietis TaxID=682979 RepID=A0A7Y9LFH8_9ACTN|nr:ABC transporter ATP-binding protein [Microlunatus parietis]NYE74146.1 iron complex transport system ATP-binding protein [Microlunatus parietis]
MELELSALSVTIDGAELVRELDLTVATGEVVGLIGPNGSGKSTVLRCIYRALAPTGGVIMIDGRPIAGMPPRATARSVAALTQDNGADLDFTVAELIALGRAPHQSGNRALSDRERRLCADAMERLELTHLADRGIHSLSGGERQRVQLARVLVQEPRILILDEPTNHLDLRHQVGALSALRGTRLTVLVVLHDLNLAALVCDRLAVLQAGRLVRHGSPAEVLTESLVQDVFGIETVIIPHPAGGRPQLLHTLSDPVPKGS